MHRRVIPAIVSLALLLAAVTPVAAGEETGDSSPPRRGSGPLIELPNGEDEFVGPSAVTHGVQDATTCRRGRPCPEHFSFLFHSHRVTAHTGEWDGYIDHRTGMACKGPCTLGATLTVQWSNRWGASIGFDRGPISGSVGFDVSFSASYSYSFSFVVPSGSTREIWYRDWYHVTDLALRTDWYAMYPPYPVTKSEFGTGWAGEWYLRVYSARKV